MRLRTMGMGTIVGEIGFHTDIPRSATVIADQETVAYRLSRKSMHDMKQYDPELAFAFQELMLRLMTERLSATNRELAALNR
jgi:SulP family sulfate permease